MGEGAASDDDGARGGGQELECWAWVRERGGLARMEEEGRALEASGGGGEAWVRGWVRERAQGRALVRVRVPEQERGSHQELRR